MRSPTSREPVNATNRTPGWPTSASPTTSPRPVQRLMTPSGMWTSRKTSSNHAAQIDVADAGFTTTVLPVARAPVIIPVRSASGKFQGEMIAPTPSGR